MEMHKMTVMMDGLVEVGDNVFLFTFSAGGLVFPFVGVSFSLTSGSFSGYGMV